ncbi:MAG: PAS domain S-box protein [Desulfobacterales bacterium]|nr:PAS domain S-box protein [Desulfobacterales bacterium]
MDPNNTTEDSEKKIKDEFKARLKNFVESSKLMSACNRIEQLGPLLLEEFAKNMDAMGGSIYLKEGNCFLLLHSLDPGHAPITISFPLRENSIFEQAIKQGEPVYIKDILKNSGLSSSGWKGYKDGSLLVFPLFDENDKTIGVISLHNKKGAYFTNKDLELGAILACFCCETLRAARAVAALQESEEKYRTVLEANPDPVIICDVKHNIQYINPSFTKIFGWTNDEIYGKSIDFFVPKDKILESKDFMKKLADGEILSCIESKRLNKNETLITVSISGAIYKDRNSQPSGFVINIRDITKQKQIEAQISQSQKNEAIGTLAGGIAHDFNNILSAVIGYAELSILELPEKNKIRTNLKMLLNACYRATDLVNQLMILSRHKEQERKPILLHPIVKEVVKFLRASLPTTIEIRHNISITQDLIIADFSQIHQALINLATNAHHAMKEGGGTLEINLKPINIDKKNINKYPDLKKGRYLMLIIKDTGSGIDDSTKDKIFDPYYTTKDKEFGTGLGLAVVNGIIKKHDGTIYVNSEAEKGTTFQIFLPVIEKDEEEIKNGKKIRFGKESVLFIDDEKALVDLTIDLLEFLGYTVTATTIPREALQMFKDNPHKFDFVITDMTMPKITGDVLAIEMLKIRPDIPIILCTGYSELINEEAALKLGIKGFMLKPFTIYDLSQIITKILS